MKKRLTSKGRTGQSGLLSGQRLVKRHQVSVIWTGSNGSSDVPRLQVCIVSKTLAITEVIKNISSHNCQRPACLHRQVGRSICSPGSPALSHILSRLGYKPPRGLHY